MRQIFLDTETTGLEPSQGHRVIEIGCVELVNRRRTDRQFHQYLNPDRDIEDGAYDVHGITNEFLSGKHRFSDIAREFIDFIRDSELIIHNAPFDLAFLNAELAMLGAHWGRVEDYCRVTDTLIIARDRHPGLKNSLDALCQRYNVDNSQREVHGALLDAQILVDVYLAMTGGQTALSLDDHFSGVVNLTTEPRRLDPSRPALRVIPPSEEELAAHFRRLEVIDRESQGRCLWKRIKKQ